MLCDWSTLIWNLSKDAPTCLWLFCLESTYLRRPRSLNFRDQCLELPSQSHPTTCTEHRLWYRPHREVCKNRPSFGSTSIWYSMPTSGCISQHVPLPWLQLKEVERPPSNTCWSCDFLLVPPRFLSRLTCCVCEQESMIQNQDSVLTGFKSCFAECATASWSGSPFVCLRKYCCTLWHADKVFPFTITSTRDSSAAINAASLPSNVGPCWIRNSWSVYCKKRFGFTFWAKKMDYIQIHPGCPPISWFENLANFFGQIFIPGCSKTQHLDVRSELTQNLEGLIRSILRLFE